MHSLRAFLISWRGLAIVGLGVLLLAKFVLPTLLYTVPLGYDSGIYRYLFLKHAQVWPFLSASSVDPWAREHPLGLFVFTSPLLKLGMPVDWLLTWMWGLMAAGLLACLGYVTARRFDTWTGIATVAAGLLSIAFFDSFAAMHWKALASLLWFVLALFALDSRRYLLFVICGVVCVAIHHQTGLLFLLTTATYLVLHIPHRWEDVPSVRWQLALPVAVVGLIGMAALVAVYLPLLQTTVLRLLPKLFEIGSSEGGNFSGLLFFLKYEGILLALGVGGLVLRARHDWRSGSVLALAWAAAFVLLQMFFHRRFFLHLDFFLLPYAGVAMIWLWRSKWRWLQPLLALLLGFQAVLTVYWMLQRPPVLLKETYQALHTMSDVLEEDALVIGLENQIPPFLLGWLPNQEVGGPGLFGAPLWNREDWQAFIYGMHEERVELLSELRQPLYGVVSPFFYSYYGEAGRELVKDACFHPTRHPLVFRMECR